MFKIGLGPRGKIVNVITAFPPIQVTFTIFLPILTNNYPTTRIVPIIGNTAPVSERGAINRLTKPHLKDCQFKI